MSYYPVLCGYAANIDIFWKSNIYSENIIDNYLPAEKKATRKGRPDVRLTDDPPASRYF